MIRRGSLNVPVIGVAKAGWSLDQLRQRAHESLEKHGGVDQAAFSKLMELLNYIDGDYQDANTFKRLREVLGKAQLPTHYLAIPPSLFATVIENLAASESANHPRVTRKSPSAGDPASPKDLDATLHPFFPDSS